MASLSASGDPHMEYVAASTWRAVADELVTPQFCDALRRDGFAMTELMKGAAVSLHASAASATELLNDPTAAAGSFKPHTFVFGGSAKPVRLRKPGVYEIDMHDGAARANGTLAPFKSLHESGALLHAFAEHMPELNLSSSAVDGSILKVQFNDGRGGCFPLHYDNPGPPSMRKLTCLCYMNPEWESGHGGELELLPFLAPAPIKVEPTMGRVVVFFSDRILHRVLPARQPRLCFTIWLDSASANPPEDVQLKAKCVDPGVDLRERVAMFQASPLQRVISRAVYDQEQVASIRECMELADDAGPQSLAACRAMLAEHDARVVALRRTPALAAFLDELALLRRGVQDGAGADSAATLTGAGEAAGVD